MKIEVEREEDGRWIAEVAELPGVLAYGASMAEARGKAEALALRRLRVCLDKVRHLKKSITNETYAKRPSDHSARSAETLWVASTDGGCF